MRLHVDTSITTSTGKCRDVIATAIEEVINTQNELFIPNGLKTTSKISEHNTRKWYSYIDIDSSVGKAIARHTAPSKRTPHILLVVYDYISALAAYNGQTTGDCQICVSWVVG